MRLFVVEKFLILDKVNYGEYIVGWELDVGLLFVLGLCLVYYLMYWN